MTIEARDRACDPLTALRRFLEAMISIWCIQNQSITLIKTICGADCWTDHRLVVRKLNLRIQPVLRHQGKKAPKRLNVRKLNQHGMRQVFLMDICNQLGAFNLSSENACTKRSLFSCNCIRRSISQTSRLG